MIRKSGKKNKKQLWRGRKNCVAHRTATCFSIRLNDSLKKIFWSLEEVKQYLRLVLGLLFPHSSRALPLSLLVITVAVQGQSDCGDGSSGGGANETGREQTASSVDRFLRRWVVCLARVNKQWRRLGLARRLSGRMWWGMEKTRGNLQHLWLRRQLIGQESPSEGTLRMEMLQPYDNLTFSLWGLELNCIHIYVFCMCAYMNRCVLSTYIYIWISIYIIII